MYFGNCNEYCSEHVQTNGEYVGSGSGLGYNTLGSYNLPKITAVFSSLYLSAGMMHGARGHLGAVD